MLSSSNSEMGELPSKVRVDPKMTFPRLRLRKSPSKISDRCVSEGTRAEPSVNIGSTMHSASFALHSSGAPRWLAQQSPGETSTAPIASSACVV
eukprot:CAMPEP_0176085094 /NCGR_PEP_ID=MMETSP0120_2-20121206/42588_1 /TAXON_ID=160619 /ORGANISM="Kryptoperidinium foliaceum, Strain CCMP 1326" /LENGTH=93 /DNA_ID=CAMNT_0017418909 /DNA_START=163 /DNA_END=444 /DNA_ORIENTATION=-